PQAVYRRRTTQTPAPRPKIPTSDSTSGSKYIRAVRSVADGSRTNTGRDFDSTPMLADRSASQSTRLAKKGTFGRPARAEAPGLVSQVVSPKTTSRGLAGGGGVPGIAGGTGADSVTTTAPQSGSLARIFLPSSRLVMIVRVFCTRFALGSASAQTGQRFTVTSSGS